MKMEENKSKGPAVKHQRRNILSKYLLLIETFSAMIAEQNNVFTHRKMFTLRGLSIYVGAVLTVEESLTGAEGFVCCSSSVLTGNINNAVRTHTYD